MDAKRRQMIREAILGELEQRGKTRYWLSQAVKMHPNLVNRALSDGHDMRVSTAEKMLKALGLSVGPDHG